jgi:Tfp pilus assembly protein FimT
LIRLAIIAALALAPGAAFAQSTTPAPDTAASSPTTKMTSPSNTTGAAMAPGTSTGIRTADSATLAVRFATVKPADFMTTKLIGADVYNKQKEKLGEIEDLAIENGHDITGIVVSVGGFLGIGESYVVLDPATVVVNQKDGTWQAFVDTSKDTLKNAPKFTYSKKKS